MLNKKLYTTPEICLVESCNNPAQTAFECSVSSKFFPDKIVGVGRADVCNSCCESLLNEPNIQTEWFEGIGNFINILSIKA